MSDVRQEVEPDCSDGRVVVSLHAVASALADGVADHAERLSAALSDRGWTAARESINWRRDGWPAAARQIRRVLKGQPDAVILHYSHLAWSRRGLPFAFLAITLVCRLNGRVILWIHDPGGISPDSFRRRIGLVVKSLGLRFAAMIATGVVTTVHPTRLDWLGRKQRRASRFCPSPPNIYAPRREPPDDLFTVACFGTGLTQNQTSMSQLKTLAAGISVLQPVRLRILGAMPPMATADQQYFHDRGIELDIPGRQESADLGRRLSMSHVFCQLPLGLTTRSGTLGAALACGLPVVGMRCSETGPPLEGLGIRTVEPNDVPSMAAEVVSISHDVERQFAMELANLHLAGEYFSWTRASRSVSELLLE